MNIFVLAGAADGITPTHSAARAQVDIIHRAGATPRNAVLISDSVEDQDGTMRGHTAVDSSSGARWGRNGSNHLVESNGLEEAAEPPKKLAFRDSFSSRAPE